MAIIVRGARRRRWPGDNACDDSGYHAATVLLALIASAQLTACSPTFDWREARFEGSALVAMFPCRPDHQVRRSSSPGSARRCEYEAPVRPVARRLRSASSTLPDPALAAASHGVSWRAVRGRERAGRCAARSCHGASPGPRRTSSAARISTRARLTGWGAVVEHAAFFAHGRKRFTRLSVIGARPEPRGALKPSSPA